MPPASPMPVVVCAQPGCGLSFLKEPAVAAGRTIGGRPYCRACFEAFSAIHIREAKADAKRLQALRAARAEGADPHKGDAAQPLVLTSE